MDGKIATIAGATALAVTPVIAGATPAPSEPAVPVAASYADLLSTIPNAVERLKVSDAQTESAQPQLIEAQYVPHHHHHHNNHNHYRRYNRAWYMAHGYYWYGGRWVVRPRNHHHHHHHHHHNNY